MNRQRQSGLTLVELSIAMAIAAIGVTAAVTMLSTGQKSQEWINEEGSALGNGRDAVTRVAEDLRNADSGGIEIVTLKDGNHQVTLRTAIGSSDGTTIWGIHERSLGGDDDARTKVGWSVRYTVLRRATGAGATAGTEAVLCRQIVDADDNVVKTTALAAPIRRGDVDPPGFQVQKTGLVWVVRMALDVDRDAIRQATFQATAHPWNSQ